MSRYFGRPYYKVYRVYEEPTDWFWIKNETENDSSISFGVINGNPSSNPQYSSDGFNWEDLIRYTNISIPAGEKIYLRSLNGFSDEIGQWYIQPNFTISVGGNLATLVDWKNKDFVSNFPDFFLKGLFAQCQGLLIDASQLTTGNVSVAGRCSFKESFFGTAITSLGDFSSLKSIGQESFSQCFQNCYNLTEGIDLSNVTEVGYRGMFYMYYNCRNLSDVTAPNPKQWDSGNSQYWLYSAGYDVTGTKTAHVPDGLTIPTDSGGIYNNWTRVTYSK